jgi:hypothetical protein
MGLSGGKSPGEMVGTVDARGLAGESSPAAKGWPGLLTNYGKQLGNSHGARNGGQHRRCAKKTRIGDEACRRRRGVFSRGDGDDGDRSTGRANEDVRWCARSRRNQRTKTDGKKLTGDDESTAKRKSGGFGLNFGDDAGEDSVVTVSPR